MEDCVGIYPQHRGADAYLIIPRAACVDDDTFTSDQVGHSSETLWMQHEAMAAVERYRYHATLGACNDLTIEQALPGFVV